MEKLRFDSIIWPQNPSSLTVSHSRSWSEQKAPFGAPCVQDLGRESVVAEGEGVFRGKNAGRVFQSLAQRQLEASPGVLCLPGYPPMMARLLKLELIGQSNPERVGYRFFFLEDQQAEAPKKEPIDRGVCFASEGDTLWKIALEYDTTVEALAEKNPHIQWPGYLTEGERVVIP